MGKNMGFLLAFTGLVLISSAAGADWTEWSILWPWKDSLMGEGLKNYCESWRINVELNNIKGFDVVPQECVAFVGKYMTSSQYKADIERAIEESVLYLNGGCCNLKGGDGKDAWIFDIDDTLVSIVPYYKKHHFGGEKLNMTSLEEWMKRNRAPAIGETLRFYNEIRGRGFKIFLISSRRESLRSHTADNLIKVGYHGWTKLILRKRGDESMEVGKYKAKARKELVEEGGYRIWGIVGDQWSSFQGTPSAKRTFKLPNPLYYVS